MTLNGHGRITSGSLEKILDDQMSRSGSVSCDTAPHLPLFGTTGWSVGLRERAESEKSYTREPWPENLQQQRVRCPEPARAVRMVAWRY
jgi:hypothetical protein